MQVGLGTMPNSINGVFSQGSIQNTSEATNVAVEGNGFFIVGNSAEDRFYTRAGNFSFNREGYMIDPSGKYVLGYTEKDANGSIVSSGPLDRIYMPVNIMSPPAETTLMQIFANLDVRDGVGSTYGATVTVYDSKGSPHNVTINFTHNGLVGGNDQWAYDVTLPGADVVGGVVGTPFSIGAGLMEFDGTGTMILPAADVALVTPAFTNGANAMNFNWDLYDDDGVPSFTGYPSVSATNSTNTDGYGPGNLTSLIISNDGLIQGVFSNGQVEETAQLAMANFNNPRGLLRLGRNLYLETNASGGAAIGSPGSGGRGTVVSAALEASNVDIATEFTNMLIFERGYQANSRIITTSDEVIKEALSLKR
jgi:flagellar hook protein FlgE